MQSLAVGDLNGDGKLDVVVPQLNSTKIYVYLGNGDGTFTSARIITGGAHSDIVVLGDFNRDGKLDAAVTSTVFRLNLMYGNGDGTFQPPQAYAVASRDGAAAADFNHDGALDLITVGSDVATVLLNTGK